MDPAERERINARTREWRQGDCTLAEDWFLFRISPASPVSPAASTAAQEDVDIAEVQVAGFVVVTQTCDIVRDCGERPFVEVCPLVEVSPERAEEIRKGRRPSFGFVPGVSEHCLVADLDRSMTVEKPVLAAWKRIRGCRDDEEIRRFSLALARKRVRFAFPDDFTRLAERLRSRVVDKHGRASDEGRALAALREIRVRAAPSWDAPEVELTFWFIRDEDEPTFERHGWAHYLEMWLDRLPPQGRFVAVEGVVVTLDDLTARDYVESDPLDLDHLSIQSG